MIVNCEKCSYEFRTGGEEKSSAGSVIECPECGHVTTNVEPENKAYPDAEVEPEEFKIGDSPDPEKQDSDFNLEDLSIDHDEPEYPFERTPAMFEDEEPGSGELPPGQDREYPEITTEANVTSGGRTDNPSVDMDILASNPHARQPVGAGTRGGADDNSRTYGSGSGRGGGILSKLVYSILSISVLSVILIASYIILLHLGIVPKDSASKVTELVESVVPLKLGEIGGENVIITDHHGRWLGTRNGYLYVVSGMVENKSEVPVSYIKIRSEFMAGGQGLYQSEVYAGNTFTDNELKVSPLQDILLKLQKKNGNTNYYNTDRIAGLNYDIRPGESIPFYAVFPSTSRLLGLKYRLEVAGYEN